MIDFEEVRRRRDVILGLTGDMTDSDKQFIIECIAATMDLPEYLPPENPPVSMDDLIAEARRTMPPGAQRSVGQVHLHGSLAASEQDDDTPN